MVQHTAFDSFLLFGDSLTQFSFDVDHQGFGAQLANAYQRRLDVINRGFSGYTSDQGIHLLPQLLPRKEQQQERSPKIQFLTICFGANDAVLESSPQHVPLERYKENLREMIGMVHDPSQPTYSPETRIILICPPPVDIPLWTARCESENKRMDKNKDSTERYSKACLEIGQEYQSKNSQQPPRHHQLHVIDAWTLVAEQLGKGPLTDYLIDGVHLGFKGNKLFFDQIMKVVETHYPEWTPAKLPLNAPYWMNLDRQHPETDLLICANRIH
ncbi:SGNH hydrolase-type esterase domain-containing protein [Mortierella sp. GBAus27b]|nr:SGNH hydrolase-type esterase domain-containing protein [Mortierella sp. GBAus27b]